MGITYEDAVKAQKELEDKILADPNVVSVGVIAELNEIGEKTGDFIIKIGVISGEKYQSSVAHGDSLIPREYILSSDSDKGEKKCVRIQVVKTGQIRALSQSEKSKKNELPSAVDNIPAASSEAISDHSSRRRPTPGGSGRTTGYTTGTVISINQSVKVDYGNFGILTFKDQICTTSMSKGGDSGSCLFEKGTKKPVGLLFAGDDSESFHNPIKSVVSQLSMESFNKYPSGKTHKFDVDFSLRLIQKRPYSTMARPATSFHNSVSPHSLKFLPFRCRAVMLVTASIGISATTAMIDKLKITSPASFFKTAGSTKSVEIQPTMNIFPIRRK